MARADTWPASSSSSSRKQKLGECWAGEEANTLAVATGADFSQLCCNATVSLRSPRRRVESNKLGEWDAGERNTAKRVHKARKEEQQQLQEARRSCHEGESNASEIVIMTHNPGRSTWILIAAAFVSPARRQQENFLIKSWSKRKCS